MVLFDNYQNGATYTVKNSETLTLITHQGIDKNININLNFIVEENAVLNIYNVITSNKDCILTEDVKIIGKDAKVEIINVLLGSSNKIESNVWIHHEVEKTYSEFSNYGIAAKDAKLILNNNASIVQGAKKSVVHQKAKGLTLSKKAIIEAKPNLFIDEYDVIANHAASIGSINEEDLFYLTSRGLTTLDATELIILGFIKPILDKITDQQIVDKLMNDFIAVLKNR